MNIGIIGAGHVGAAIGFLLAGSGVARRVTLVNRTEERARAEAADISHALPITGYCYVRHGEFSDLANADVVVVTSGAKRGEVGRDRLDLLRSNIAIYVEAIRNVARVVPTAIIIVVSNPVDVLAGITASVTSISNGQIISSGTLLDSTRFAMVLSDYFRVPVNLVHADVFGEHGDTQVPVWSRATISGQPIEDFAKQNNFDFSMTVKSMLSEQTRLSADAIIHGKGSTYYGIAGSVVKICQALNSHQPTTLNISTYHENFGNVKNVFISRPVVIADRKIERHLPLEISDEEKQALFHSANIIHGHTQAALQMIT